MSIDNVERMPGITPDAAPACDLLVLSPIVREEHIALARSLLFVKGHRITERADGLSFTLPASRFDDVARFVSNERRCCSHLGFTIVVPPRSATLELRITGDGVREGLSAIGFRPDSTPVTRERP